MSIQVNVTPEIEAQVAEAARAEGIDEQGFALRAVLDRLRTQRARATRHDNLTAEETLLLQAINRTLPDAVWQRYSDLVKLRRAETLTEEEHRELLDLSEVVEEDHVSRIEHLIRLAKLWNSSLDDVMNRLGIKPRPV